MASCILNSENPFTDEVHNATRISVIVVDVAGEILRKKLEEIILNIRNIHSSNRYDRKSYNNVHEYFLTNQNIFKDNTLFYEEQINAMYPNRNPTAQIVNNEKFDITLCTMILQNLVLKPTSGWSTKKWPNHDDNSFGANIMRIKIIRNNNWAHVHKFGMKDAELKRSSFNKSCFPKNSSLLAKLEHAIYSLCNDSNEIEYYKKKIDKSCECEIDEKKVKLYRNKIANLLAKDLETHEILIKEIGEIEKNNHIIINLINENKTNDMKHFDKIKNLQLNLLKNLDDKFMYILTRDEFKEEINILRNELLGQGDQIISNISESYSNTVYSISNEISQVRDLVIQSNKITNCNIINIVDFKSYFDDEFPSFKILILDYELFNLADDEKQKLINSIAFLKWNIIVDLNRLNTGIEKNICEVYKKKLKINFLLKKIEEKASITDSDKYCIANNTLLCYFFDKEIGNFAEEFQMFLKEKELNLTQKRIMCTNLFLRKDYTTDMLDEIEGINIAVKSAVYQTNKKEILDLIYIFTDNNVNHKDIQSSFGKKIKNAEKKLFESTLSKFISDTAPILDSKEVTKQFLPSKDGQKMEWDEKYNCYSGFIEVYHENIGRIFY